MADYGTIERFRAKAQNVLSNVSNGPLTGTAGAIPGGPAGGALAGTYPNPTLAATAVVGGTYGNSRQIPSFDVNSAGQLTYVQEDTIFQLQEIVSSGITVSLGPTVTEAIVSGVSTQAIILPLATNVQTFLGNPVKITNRSTGAVTVYADLAALQLVATLATDEWALFTCIDKAADVVASWNVNLVTAGGGATPIVMDNNAAGDKFPTTTTGSLWYGTNSKALAATFTDSVLIGNAPTHGVTTDKTLNVVVGSNNKVGDQCVAVGSFIEAQGQNATDYGNTAVGCYSLSFGLGNTSVGYTSDIRNGIQNTAIGFDARCTTGTTFCTSVGSEARCVTSNSTAVGANSRANGSNTLSLGAYAVSGNFALNGSSPIAIGAPTQALGGVLAGGITNSLRITLYDSATGVVQGYFNIPLYAHQ